MTDFNLEARAREGCGRADWLCKGDMCPDCKRVKSAMRDALQAAEDVVRALSDDADDASYAAAYFSGVRRAADAIRALREPTQATSSGSVCETCELPIPRAANQDDGMCWCRCGGDGKGATR